MQAEGAEERLDDALEREEVGGATARRPRLRPERTAEHDGDGLGLVRQHDARLGRMRGRRADLVVPEVHSPEFEEVGRVVEPRDVVAQRADEPGEQRGAHHRLLDAHRVAQPHGPQADVAVGEAERRGGVRRHEGVGDDLVEAAGRQGAPHGAPHLLRRGQAARRGVARQRLGRPPVAGDASDLLDEVDLALEVGTERRAP